MNLATTPNVITITDIEKMAKAIATSGMFGLKTEEQAFALMLVAQAEGLHPAIAARDYHVINNKPTLKSDAMMARFQAAGGRVKWIKLNETEAIATFSHEQGGSMDITWTIDMAFRAGLMKNPTWKTYPRSMLRARCISEGIRTVFPGVVAGYCATEEVEDLKSDMHDINPAPEKPVKAKKSSRLDSIVEAQPEVVEAIPEVSNVYLIDTDIAAMNACESLEALKEVFSNSWKSCPQELREALKITYDELKEKFQQEETPV